MMTILFWTAILLISYVYLGYPLLLRALTALVGGKEVARGEIEPRVTLMISAYNEERVMGEKLRNSLALDYPKEKLEILVVSDCSTDRTDEIVRGFSSQGVVLNRMETRRGKTWGLNESVPKSSGEILLFSDANALYRSDAVQKLVRNFHDPEVGCVTGESQYIDTDRSSVGWQEDCYWNYERLLKIDETWRGSMVGSDGAIFAIRRGLYEPLHESDINDFVVPLQIVKKGFRCVYEPEAVCKERGTVRYEEEFRRKVRVVNRSVYALRKMKGLLNPFRFGWFSFQLLSHKVLRWCMPIWLGVLLLSNLALSGRGGFYRLSLYAQGFFYMLALAGGGLSTFRMKGIRIITIPYYFCMVNTAAFCGIMKGLMGRVQVIWNPERETGRPAA